MVMPKSVVETTPLVIARIRQRERASALRRARSDCRHGRIPIAQLAGVEAERGVTSPHDLLTNS